MRRALAALTVSTLAVCVAAGCGDTPSPTSPPRSTRGVVEGRVTLAAAVRNPMIAPGMGVEGPVPSERVLTGEGLGLGDCVVSLEPLPSSGAREAIAPAPASRATLTVVPGRFEPHVQVVRVGTQLALVGGLADDLLVHAYALGDDGRRRETVFDVALSPGRRLDDVADLFLARPGVVFVTDDCRGGYQAWIHVVDHAFVELTSAADAPSRPSGSFRLVDVPPGAYDVVVWHEALDLEIVLGPGGRPRGHVSGPPIRISRRVTVRPGQILREDVVVPPSGASPR